ncbi:beta-propeller fold lactonase family protein [Marinicella sp. W31]|uniref:beta-propeller fold lactonase family protein n=1 Tax=Marinicella sp. W31 TaxID=3023713 RepID=UPI003756983D
MKTSQKYTIWVLLFSCMSFAANAKLAQPDYVLYGTATWFGQPLATGSEISIYLDSQLVTAATYSMGTQDNLGGLYALRVPMDSNDPRTFGKARPGDPASVFINGNLVAEVLIGDYGLAERLDIDPANLGGDTAIVSIQPGEALEGNSGTQILSMTIGLSQTSDEDVSVNWATSDDSAIGSDACNFDVDYIQNSGTAQIPAQMLETSIQVEVCGDTLIEGSESFDVVLSAPVNAVIQLDRAAGTILDDDGLPELSVFDMVVFEPQAGSLVQGFELRLSRTNSVDVTFDASTIVGTAAEGLDFVANSGQFVIAAGQQELSIPVEFLADGLTEGIEVMGLQITNVRNATLISDSATAFILDSDREEQTEKQDEIDQSQVLDLLNPSDVLISNDDQHVYVSSLSGSGSLLQFNLSDGALSFVNTINNTVTGFESGLFSQIRQIAMTPDGRFLYAAASGDNAIMAFQRNTTTGALTLAGTMEETTPGDMGITAVHGLAVSPDGKHLYAAGSNSDSIGVFSIDDTLGTLTFVEAEVQGANDADDSGGVVTFMDRPVRLTVSADGNHVYVAADFSSSVAVFNRDQTSGELSFMESLKSGVNGVTSIGGAAGVNVSQDGAHVYVIGRADDAVVKFNRGVDGSLTFDTALTQSNTDFIGLDAPNAVISNPADDRLYVVGFDDSSMVTFSRDTALGNLEFADIEQDGVNGVDKMNGPTALDITSDGAWVIVAAGVDNALVVFDTPRNDLIFKNGFE